MKYIKSYESISTYLHKYDLLLKESEYSFYDYDLYILLNDVPKPKRILNVFHIAEISFDRNRVRYDIVNLEEEKLYKKEDIRIFTEEEKYLLFKDISLTNPSYLVNKIKQELNYDITTSEDYQNFITSQSANKFNL